MAAQTYSFTYTALESDDFIRLLHILPGTGDGQLSVLCKDHARDEELDYTAISYTWDNQQPTREILVNDQRLLITHNAYQAISALRQSDRRHCVWIDAICINQADDSEKIKQVRRMREVYQSGQNTMVWLGDATPALTAAINFVPTLTRALTNLLSDLDPPPVDLYETAHLDELFERLDVSRDDHIWLKLYQFLSLPWFRRAWIIQEVAVSRVIFIRCGESRLEWPALMNLIHADGLKRTSVISFFCRIPGFDYFADSRISLTTMDSVRQTIMQHSLVSATVLQRIFNFHATNPKDKIFSIIGLIESVGPLQAMRLPITSNVDSDNNENLEPCRKLSTNLQADYHSPTQDVYTEATVLALSQVTNLILISIGALQETKMNNLPSWVPDYSQVYPTPQLFSATIWEQTRLYEAAGLNKSSSFFQQPSLIRPDTLLMIGQFVDGISSCTSTFSSKRYDNDNAYANKWIVELQNVFELVGLEGVLSQWNGFEDEVELVSTTHEVTSRLLTTLTAENPFVRTPTWHFISVTDKDQFFWVFMSWLVEVSGSPLELPGVIWDAAKTHFRTEDAYDHKFRNCRNYCIAAVEVTTKRRFAVTAQGRYALVPSQTQKGDIIALIRGAECPYVIRRAADSDDGHERYTLVGDCYVNGIMHGEAFDEEQMTGIALV